MKHFVILFFLTPFITLAQTKLEKEEIMKPVHLLFKGMQLGDSSLVRQAFVKDATMISIGKDKEGNQTFRKSSIDNFLKAIGTPHKDSWNEPIWDTKIAMDGEFAHVWTSYAFYAGKTFSHCGVDAFQLVKSKGEWKIFSITDTRKKEGCEIPKKVSENFK